MDDRIHSDRLKSGARLKLVPRTSTPHRYEGLASIGADSDIRVRLISSRDAAISRSLQEQTQLVLATLTPREQLVLRVRFGIAQASDQLSEKIDEVLASGEIAFIEAAALRKLRHPSQGGRLKSVDRE